MNSLTLIRNLLFSACLLAGGPLHGAPYGPDGMPLEWVQSNGEKIKLRVFGDEFYARTETEDGYTVVYDPVTRDYCYAEKSADGTRLQPGRRRAHQPPPPGLARKIQRLPAERRRILTARQLELRSEASELRWKEKVRNARQRHADKARKAEAGGNRAKVRRAGGTVEPDGPQPTPHDEEQVDQDAPANSNENEEPDPQPVVENVVGLTIMLQFPDDPETLQVDPVLFPATGDTITNLCNQENYSGGGNTGSVKDYFSRQSNGALNYTQIVVPVINLEHPKNYYNYSDYPANIQHRAQGSALRLMILDAIPAIIDSGIDFSGLSLHSNGDVRALNVLWAGSTSGQWSQGLWPHKWLLAARMNIGTAANPIYLREYQGMHVELAVPAIGTFVHENGHLILDVPDLYDLDRADDVNGPSKGVGRYCLMGSGASNNGSRTPAPLNLHFRDILGWADVEELAPGDGVERLLSTTGNVGIRIRKPGSEDESFVIENLSSDGNPWAANIPDNGIAIWHVDEAKNGQGGNNQQQMTEEEHYYISIQQADGLFNLEGDVNTGDNRDLYDLTTIAFSDTTIPNSRWWDDTPSNTSVRAMSLPGASMAVRVNLPEVLTLAQWIPTATPAGMGALHPYHAVAEPNPAPTTFTEGLQVSAADRVGLGNNSTNSNSVWPGRAASATFSGTNYTEFSVDPTFNGDVSYHFLTYSYFGDATSETPYTVYLRTSLDNHATNSVPAQIITSEAGTLAFDLKSVAGLQNCNQTVTFRIYADRSGNSPGAFDLRSIDGGMILGGQTRRAPVFLNNSIAGGTVETNAAFNGTLAGSASDPDPGDVLIYSKISGPAWLAIAPDGSLSGTPGNMNQGANSFTVQVSDSSGFSVQSILTIAVIPLEADVVTLAQWIPTATPPGQEATHPYHAIAQPNPPPTTFATWLNVSEADRVGQNNASLSTAIWPGSAAAGDLSAGNSYTEFTTTPAAGGFANYSFISYSYQAQQATPANPYTVYLRTSLDGFAANTVPALTLTSSPGTVVFDLRAVNALQNRNLPVTFRLYADQPGQAVGWFSLRSLDSGMHLRGQLRHAPVFANANIDGGTARAGESFVGALSGAATDLDAGDLLTYRITSGPAWLTAASSGALSGTPTEADLGMNTFAVEAIDPAGLSAQAFLRIQVEAPEPVVSDPYGDWKSFHFADNTDEPEIAGDLADPNHDGVANLMAYAMGVNPVNPPADGSTPAQLGRPAIEPIGDGFQIIYQRSLGATDVLLSIETNTDAGALDSWDPANLTEENIGDENGIRTIRATYTSAPGETGRFFRFRATR